MIRKIPNPPESTNLFRAAQSQGAYTLASSLADLIDNSISAGATEILIDIPVNEKAECLAVAILDNGTAMNCKELFDAMRPASKNPNETRDGNDLGRFGWGLKSASLAQAERLEVLTKQNGARTYAAWDLSSCDKFEMELEEETNIARLIDCSMPSSWTEVRWRSCARLTENYVLSARELSDKVASAVEDLELIFHRYLEGEDGLKKISIILNGRNLKPIDPFLRAKSTAITDRTFIPFRDGGFHYEAFALPRLNSMSEEEFARLSGQEGLVKRQGFYVYRNKRLIISGTWFNVEPYRPLNQLIRIKLDIPNSMDDVWRITVDKADAQLPQDLKRYLKNVVRNLRRHSERKLTNRTHRRKPNKESFWRLTRKSAGAQALEINLEAEVFNKPSFTQKEVLSLMSLLQASLPVDLILQNKTESFAQIEPERGSSTAIYADTLELLASMSIDWDEASFVEAASRYILMPGDEAILSTMAKEKFAEIEND